mgnify:CR=1 FL=1
MFENELDEQLHEIAQTINNIIPVEWNDIYLNSEISNGDGEVLFYFNTVNNREEFIYSHDIPSKYGIPLSDYMDTFNKLMDISRAILKILKDNNQPLWTSMILSIKNRKKISVEFDYTDWISSPFSINQRLNYFKFRYIGYQPKDDKELQRFQEMQEFQNQHNSRPL